MMIQQHLKQVRELVRSNKLYSVIYIAGTALSITMVMLVAIHFYLRTADLYPETGRRRMLYVQGAQVSPMDTTEQWTSSAFLSHRTMTECFYSLTKAKAVAGSMLIMGRGSNTISSADAPRDKKVYAKYVSSGFWQVYDLEFLSGKPFTQADFDAARPVMVLNRSLADYLFPSREAVGQEVNFMGHRYSIIGVVRDVPYHMGGSFAHLWIPYTCHEGYKDAFSRGGILGTIEAAILPRDGVSQSEVIAELEANLKRLEEATQMKINLMGQPDTSLRAMFRLGNLEIDLSKIIIGLVIIFALFFLVPALNLTALNSSVLEGRLAELGVRKAFGATNRSIIMQVLVENFVLTLLGALLGLGLAYIILSSSVYDSFVSSMITYMAGGTTSIKQFAPSISIGMLLRVEIFAFAFVSALLLNTFTSLIPAWRFTQRSIVDALSDNQASKK